MSNGVSIDPRFWDKIIGDIASWGVKTYEQDWLDHNATPSEILGHGEKFMDEMARATKANGVTLQYCMETPRHILQASRYDNVTTIRSCGDRFSMPDDWGAHLYCSQFIKAVGSWPWVDNFQTLELGNTVLCVLSAGMVGVSDTFANTKNPVGVSNLLKMVRRDGLSIKADIPMTPTDATYLRRPQGNRSYTCQTSSTVADHKIVYIWDWANGAANYSSNFKPADFGMTGNVFVYSYFEKTGQLLPATSACTSPVTGATAGKAGTDWKYYILAPLGASGIGLIGDQGKFVTFSKNRIRDFAETPSSATLSVAFGAFDAESPDEPAVITGYASDSVKVVAGDSSAVSDFVYNRQTGIFSFTFQPAGRYSGEAVRSVTVYRSDATPVRAATAANVAGAPRCRQYRSMLVFDNSAQQPLRATLFGLNGKVIRSWTIESAAGVSVPLPACANGVYEVLMQQSKKVYRQKLAIVK
jgi:hypothetical protein